MSTVRDLIKGSLRLIGALAQGENPSAEDAADALTALNEMLESWSNERLFIPSVTRELFQLVPSQQTYSMGPDEDFDATRPIEVEKVRFVDSSGAELPIEILNADQWARVTLKSQTGTGPTKVFIDPKAEHIDFHFWPVPTEARSVAVYSQTPLQTFTSINADFVVAPGYKRLVRYGLAMEIAPEYGKEPSPLVVMNYERAMAAIKIKNIKTTYLQCDSAVLNGSRFDIETGE